MAQTPTLPSQRFEAREGVIYDRKTSFLWQRCSDGQQWNHGHCAGTAKTYTWEEALDLGSGDWRLPTEPELKSLVDLDRKSKHLSPLIDGAMFPDLPRNRNASLGAPLSGPDNAFTSLPNYWTSTGLSGCISKSHLGCGAYVDFDRDDNSHWFTIPRETRLYVRLVRPAPPELARTETNSKPSSTLSADGRFVTTGGEALDRNTGLIWQRCDAGRQMVREGLGCLGVARLYTMAEALQLGGSGWRLPTRDELETLHDRKRLGQRQWPIIDTTVFLDVDEHSNTYWTSTPYGNPRNGQLYCINFTFLTPDNCGIYPQHARLVRKRP